MKNHFTTFSIFQKSYIDTICKNPVRKSKICEKCNPKPERKLAIFCSRLAPAVISISSMHRVLAHSNASYKVLYRASAQSDTVLEGKFLNEVAHLHRDMFVWGDEMGTNRNEAVHRRRGRAVVGERAVDRRFMVDRTNHSALAFMTQDGVLTHYTCVGGVTAERFNTVVSDQLLPLMQRFPLPRSVLVLDNCAVHKSAALALLCESAGVLLKFIPPYSPWLNPIEPAFRSAKAWMRRYARDYVAQGHNVMSLVTMALAQVSANACSAFINDAGYL